MEVKEIFELRKQGRVEEAYELIREKYKTYHGYHTSMCMFWCASDVLLKRLEEGKKSEAESIFRSLERMLPTMRDPEGTLTRQIIKLENKLKEYSK